MATEEPNKEFTINVQFSGVEEDILGVFKKQIDDVAKSIILVNDTMSEATKVLARVTKELKELNAGGFSGGGGFAGPASGGPVASHLAGAPRGGDGGDMVRAVGDFGRILEGLTGRSSLFGARGLTAGFRSWDQENSFEIPQFSNAGFTIQDAIRQVGAIGGMGGYQSTKDGAPISRAKLEALHKQREAHPNPNIWRDQDYYEHAADQVPWYLKPWQQQIAHIEGQEDYIASLGEGYQANHPRMASLLSKASVIAPFVSGKGGVFNPGTYGLGISGLRGKAAAIGNGYGRWDAQFGGGTDWNPLGSAGHQFFGANWQAATNSWFGMNPFLSSKQAGEIQSTVAGMGYSHGTAESMRNVMSDVTQNTNIGIKEQGEIMDKSFRWGYASLQQLADFMKHDIPVAAQAARMNVGQFSQQLVQVATGLGAQQGTGFYKAAGVVSDFATGMGLDPGTAGKIAGDNGLTMLAATIQSHQEGRNFSVGHLLNSPKAASYYAQATAQRIKQNTGIDPDLTAKLLRDANNGVPGAQEQIDKLTEKLYFQHLAGVDTPGAGTPEEIARFSKQSQRDLAVAGVSRTFGDQVSKQFARGHDDYVQHHGGDGGKSFWHSSGWNLLSGGSDSQADVAGNKKAAEWAQKQYPGSAGRMKFIRQIRDLAKADKWSDDGLGNVLGHHMVGGAGSKSGWHEEVGDPKRDVIKLMAALHKEQGRQSGKKGDKNSKSGKLQVTLTAGPGLAGLLRASVTPGAAGVQDGSNPVSTSDPSTTLGVYNTNTGVD